MRKTLTCQAIYIRIPHTHNHNSLFIHIMARILLVTFLVLLLATVFAEDFVSRIRETQTLLRSIGPTVQVLDEFDKLILDLQSLSDKVLEKTLATALYNRALVEMSLNKMNSAIDDLEAVFALDPDLKPAKNTYKEIMVKRGDFAAARTVLDGKSDGELVAQMEKWEKAFDKLKGILGGETKKYDAEECLKVVDETLQPLTPENPTVFELHLICSKKKAAESLEKDKALAEDAFTGMLIDYSNLLKKAPQKDLGRYNEFAKYLFFTQSNYQDAWNAVKNCLRIDNENKQCGSLSKAFARLQGFLKLLEEYSILDGYLYPVSDEFSDLSDEKYQTFLFDWKQIHDFLNKDPIKAPKRELKNVPSSVKNNFDYLVWMANGFADEELGNEKLFMSLKFYRDLTRLRCEAALYSEKSTDCKLYCDGAVEDAGLPFFPKHAARIDEELKKKNYAEAQKLLSQFSKHVGKTDAFRKRWSIIEKIQQKQQRQQQAKFHKEQQRQQQQQQHWYRQQQQQQQQQQRMQSDPSKDYYKVLDILRDADDKTIRKAYRTQTLKYHPDKYKGEDLDEKGVEQKMQEINEAYEVLSDKESREQYDQGRSGHSQGPNRGGSRGFNFQGGPNFGFDFNFGNSGFNFGNGGFKFGGNGFQQGKQRKKRRQ